MIRSLCSWMPDVPMYPPELPQIRAIRKKMMEIMTREASACDLKDLVAKFIPEAIGKDIEKACQGAVYCGSICPRLLSEKCCGIM